MSDQTGKLACTLWSFAIGGLAGALAIVMLVMFGGFGWNGAVFTGVLLALGIGVFLATILCRPLPTMAETEARSAARAHGTASHMAVAAPVHAAVVAVDAGHAPAVSRAAKPVLMTAARDGRPDDLKLIKGVGPKLEEMLHGMGVYHFDQIAGWSAEEVAWVDENLEGFKGRVSRDGWVDQARALAGGGAG